MKESYSDDDYQNMVQCFVDGGCDVTEASNLYLSRYGFKPSPDTIRLAIRAYGGTLGIPGSNIASSYLNNYGAPMEGSPNDVTIKKEVMEDSEDEVVVKPEYTDGDENVGSIGLLESYPIVYTTRLDDMFIFKKDFKNLEFDDIVQNITLESKPKFRNLTHKSHKSDPIRHIINPFFKLVDSVRQLNESTKIQLLDDFDTQPVKTKLSLNKRSQKLLDKCKPLYVVLVDFREVRKSPLARLQRDTKVAIEEENKPVNKISIPHSWKEIDPANITKKIKLIHYEYNCIIINNAPNINEVYYINSLGKVTFSCSETHVPQDEILPNIFVIKNCCWVAREKCINKLVNSSTPKNDATIDIMRTPHRCLPGKCSCCCKSQCTYDNDNIDFSEDDRVSLNVLSTTTPEWLKNITSIVNEDNNNIISKALNYKRDKRVKYITGAPKNATPQTMIANQIRIKNNYKKMTEMYNVRHKKIVTKYIEVKEGEHAQLHLLFGPMYTRQEEVCCWSRLNKLLWTWQFKYCHNVLNFIRTSHNCPVNDCKCCCKSKALTLELSNSSIKYTLSPKKLVHTRNYSSKTFQRMENIKNSEYTKNVEKSEKCKQTEESIVVEKSTNSFLPKKEWEIQDRLAEASSAVPNKLPSSGPMLSKAPPTRPNLVPLLALPYMLSVPSNTVSTTIHESRRLPIPANPSSTAGQITQPQLQFTSTNKQQNTIEQATVPQAKADTESLDPTVNSLVNSILHRFRDVRLTIRPDGDVSAELNTPIQNLSTAELKILSAILTHAKEQVKALKLSRETAGAVLNMSGIPMNSVSTSNMSNTILTNTIASNLPSVNSNPSMQGTSMIYSVTSHGKSLSLSRTPNIKPISSHAPSAMFTPDMSGIPIIKSVTSLAPAASRIPSPSSTPKINSTISNVPLKCNSLSSGPAGPSTSILKAALDTARTERSNSPVRNNVKNNVFQFYSNISALKAQHYINSCKSFLQQKTSNGPAPIINSVYSLNATAAETANSKNQVPANKTADDPLVIPGPSGVKRKSKTDDSSLKKPKTSADTYNGPSLHQNGPMLPKGAQNKTMSAQASPVASVTETAPNLQVLLNTPFVPPKPLLIPTVTIKTEDDTPVIIPLSIEEDESATLNPDECILGV